MMSESSSNSIVHEYFVVGVGGEGGGSVNVDNGLICYDMCMYVGVKEKLLAIKITLKRQHQCIAQSKSSIKFLVKQS